MFIEQNVLMPNNKDFAQRIEIIDSCLMRRQRKWTFDELLNTVNDKLAEQYEKSVSKRTLQYDLEYLINEKQAPIEKKRVDGKVTYTYRDANYSIKNLPISEEEILYLKDAIEILRSVSDLQIIHDVDEIISKLENTIVTNVSEKQTLIQFEKNTSSTGIQYIDDVFTAIKNKISLKVFYMPFGKQEAYEWIVHPYLLKEYRNRWFLIARVNHNQQISNIALDRIKKINNSKEPFIENDLFEPEIYFNNMIGVTLPEKETVQNIIVKVSKTQSPYLKTKPIHFSQKILREHKDGSMQIQLSLINNYELRAVLLSYGSSIEISSPAALREQIKMEFESAIEKYK